MNPVKSAFIGLGIGAAIASAVFLALYFTGCGQDREVIRITKEIPGTQKIIYVPVTDKEKQECIDSIIVIKADINTDNFMLITASDKCKSNSLGLELTSRPAISRHTIILSPIAMINYDKALCLYSQYGLQLQYYYKLTNMIGIGGGLLVTNRGGGVNAGVLLQF